MEIRTFHWKNAVKERRNVENQQETSINKKEKTGVVKWNGNID